MQKIPAAHRKRVETQLSKLSAQIQDRRKALKLTQEQLAEELGVSTMTIQYVEQKRRFPSLPLLFAILVHLGIEFRTR